MIATLMTSLAMMPTIARQLRQYREYVGDGHSVLNVIPFGGRNEPWEQLYLEALGGMDADTIDVVTDERSPLEALATRYDIAPSGDDHPVRRVVRQSAILPEVIFIRGIDGLSPAVRRQWLKLFHDWAIAANSYASEHGDRPASLSAVAVCPELFDAQFSEPWLHVQWWWSVPSALDFQVLCRLHVGGETKPIVLWREALLPVLAGNDVGLLAELWPVITDPTDRIVARLRLVADQRGWTLDRLQEWGLDTYLDDLARWPRFYADGLPDTEAKLWSRGLLYQTPVYGVQVSPVALAQLGKKTQIEHLLWRGQATLLLPFLEEQRLAICQDMIDQYGEEWVVKLMPHTWQSTGNYTREEAKRKPLGAHWGIIKQAVSNHSTDRVEIDRVKLAHGLRNKLSHGEVIDYDRYVSLIDKFSLV